MIRIAVGCAANHEDIESQAVLEYTLRKYASEEVEITWMQLSRDPNNAFYCDPEKGEGWKTKGWATPFSGFRWAVPNLFNYEGRAIYMDSDFIVRADIAELNKQEMKKGVICIASGGMRFDCVVWDCRAAMGIVPGIAQLQADANSHSKTIGFFSDKQHYIQRYSGGNWNTLDLQLPPSLDDPSVKAIHYTTMASQVHLKHALPRLAQGDTKHWYVGPQYHARPDLQHLFDMELQDARAAGYIDEKYTQTPKYGKYVIRGGV